MPQRSPGAWLSDGVEDLYLSQIETYTERTGLDCGVEDHLLIHFGATPTQELQPL